MIYVLYHKNCMDGKGAAYAAWKSLGDHNVEYIEVAHGDTLPPIEDNSEVYILDFSYPKETLIELNIKCKVVLLDHHKTAQKDLESLEFAKFDMEKSGARLAWEYFHPGIPVNGHILFIEDRDLWNWKLPNSKQYSLAAYSHINDFRDFDKILPKELVDFGYGIEKYQEKQIEIILQNSYLHSFVIGKQTYNVAVVNSPILQSEVGTLLLKKYPDCDFSYVYREDMENQYVSLRSEDSKQDVSVIAKHFYGGGHRNASGFTIRKNR